MSSNKIVSTDVIRRIMIDHKKASEYWGFVAREILKFNEEVRHRAKY